MSRKNRPESELWLWAKIVIIPVILAVYWSLVFIYTAAETDWVVWVVGGSYALLVAWFYSVWRVLLLAAWKRDRAIAEELAEQTGPFEPQWEDIGLTEEGVDLPKDWHTGHLSMLNSRAHEKYTRSVTSHLEVPISEETAEYWRKLRERLMADGVSPNKLEYENTPTPLEPPLITHDELYGGRHERTEIHQADHFYAGSDDRHLTTTYESESGMPLKVVPVQSFFPSTGAELPKADG
jgi:hypothetical protein